MANVINLNTAQPDDLTKLPGVGPAMADRIIAARPFEKIDDLLKVSGIGPALVERLTPLITVSDIESQEDVLNLGAEMEDQLEPDEASLEGETQLAEDEFPEAETGAAPQEEEWLPPDIEPEEDILKEEDIIPQEKTIITVEEESKEATPQKKEQSITWGQVLLINAGCSLLAFILAVMLSLGILGSLNGGLRYASTSQVQALNRQVNGLNSQVETLLGNVDSLRTRLNNLDSLRGRTSELEAQTEQLNADMAITTEIVEGMKVEIEEIAASAERFQLFLDSLSELLNTLAQPPAEVP